FHSTIELRRTRCSPHNAACSDRVLRSSHEFPKTELASHATFHAGQWTVYNRRGANAQSFRVLRGRVGGPPIHDGPSARVKGRFSLNRARPSAPTLAARAVSAWRPQARGRRGWCFRPKAGTLPTGRSAARYAGQGV